MNNTIDALMQRAHEYRKQHQEPVAPADRVLVESAQERRAPTPRGEENADGDADGCIRAENVVAIKTWLPDETIDGVWWALRGLAPLLVYVATVESFLRLCESLESKSPLDLPRIMIVTPALLESPVLEQHPFEWGVAHGVRVVVHEDETAMPNIDTSAELIT